MFWVLIQLRNNRFGFQSPFVCQGCPLALASAPPTSFPLGLIEMLWKWIEILWDGLRCFDLRWIENGWNGLGCFEWMRPWRSGLARQTGFSSSSPAAHSSFSIFHNIFEIVHLRTNSPHSCCVPSPPKASPGLWRWPPPHVSGAKSIPEYLLGCCDDHPLTKRNCLSSR